MGFKWDGYTSASISRTFFSPLAAAAAATPLLYPAYTARFPLLMDLMGRRCKKGSKAASGHPRWFQYNEVTLSLSVPLCDGDRRSTALFGTETLLFPFSPATGGGGGGQSGSFFVLLMRREICSILLAKKNFLKNAISPIVLSKLFKQ